MAKEEKEGKGWKPFLEEVEDAILDAGFPVLKGDGTWIEPKDEKKNEEKE